MAAAISGFGEGSCATRRLIATLTGQAFDTDTMAGPVVQGVQFDLHCRWHPEAERDLHSPSEADVDVCGPAVSQWDGGDAGPMIVAGDCRMEVHIGACLLVEGPCDARGPARDSASPRVSRPVATQLPVPLACDVTAIASTDTPDSVAPMFVRVLIRVAEPKDIVSYLQLSERPPVPVAPTSSLLAPPRFVGAIRRILPPTNILPMALDRAGGEAIVGPHSLADFRLPGPSSLDAVSMNVSDAASQESLNAFFPVDVAAKLAGILLAWTSLPKPPTTTPPDRAQLDAFSAGVPLPAARPAGAMRRRSSRPASPPSQMEIDQLE
jgi:hypothetical protein